MDKKLSVLVIEDSDQDCILLIEELKRNGFSPEYERIETRSEMEEMLEKRSWDLIVADYRLPRFNLKEVINVLNEQNLDLPLIIVSGFLDEEMAVESLKAGAHDFIMKNNLARLVPAINRELREAKNRNKQRQSEEALRKSEEQYRLLAEHVTDVIFTMDLKLHFKYLSPSVERMTGYTIEEILIKSLREILTQSSFKDAVQAYRKGLFEEKRSEQEYPQSPTLELEVKGKDQTTVWVDVSITVLKDDQKNPIGILGVARNITKRKKTEEEKDRIQQLLFQSQKMEAIGALTGGVAHDFNNLLTAIQGYTDMALKSLDNRETLYNELKQIQVTAERAAELTQQLLLFSRKQPMELMPLNINDIIRDLLKLLQRLIGEDIGVSTTLDPDLFMIEADKSSIEQMVMNLIVNARDAMPNGGMLTIQTENATLGQSDCRNISDLKPGEYVKLSIEDTGVGIDEEILSHIFEPFYSTKNAGEGTGLGLSVVYGIVKGHDGWIYVESHKDQGTAFNIYIPSIQDKKRKVLPKADSFEDIQGGSERILILEDEDVVREFARRALTNHGYQVFPASNASEAMMIFEREGGQFDLIFSDVVLPDKSGVKVVNAFLNMNPKIRILMTSGYTDKKSQWEVICERGYAFLEKPYNLHDLIRSVRKTLESNNSS